VIASLEIDLGAVRRNVVRMREIAAPAAFGAVVKANAYGHGIVEVARAIAHDVDTFCTYRADEAATLRAAGIANPIVVLGPVEPHEISLAHESRASIALWSKGSFRRDAARVARELEGPLGIHAKIETGLARLGLDADRATAAVASYLDDPDFVLGGVFTHLAAAEELESAFTREQLARFGAALAPLGTTLAERGVRRHAAASAAAMLYPESRLDLIRSGIAIYGIWPSPQTERAMEGKLVLEPALSWRTSIVAIRAVDTDRPVGYGCTYRTTRPSRIAVLPIGYAEGIPRAASNCGHVLVLETLVPIVGRICMNMAFIDVTDVPDASVGSIVTLIGRDGALQRTANEFAADAGTIGYEIVARLPRDIPRSYVGARAAARRVHHATAEIASARSSVPS
jgi:alanine racemase